MQNYNYYKLTDFWNHDDCRCVFPLGQEWLVFAFHKSDAVFRHTESVLCSPLGALDVENVQRRPQHHQQHEDAADQAATHH